MLFVKPFASVAPSTSNHSTNKAAVVGGVLGSLLGLVVIAGVVIVLVFRRRSSRLAPRNHTVSPFTTDLESNSQPEINARAQRRGLLEKRSDAANSPIVSPVLRSYPVPTVPPSQTSAATEGTTPAASPIHHPEASANANSARPSLGAQPVLVDHIIELIAQRIDRRPDRATGGGNEAPPCYPESAA